MQISAQASEVDFCLRGEIGGMEKIYPLKEGVNQLGSLATNEIVLPASGVSRVHARLTFADGTLEVEDLASKNGTFLGRSRIQQARVVPGQVVRFGPVPLRFQELHRDCTARRTATSARPSVSWLRRSTSMAPACSRSPKTSSRSSWPPRDR